MLALFPSTGKLVQRLVKDIKSVVQETSAEQQVRRDSALQVWFNVEIQQPFTPKRVIEKREKPVKQQQDVMFKKHRTMKRMKREPKIATFSHRSRQAAAAIVEVGGTHKVQTSSTALSQTPAITIAKVHPSSIEIAPQSQQPLSMTPVHSINPAEVMFQCLNAEQQHYQLQ